MTKEQRKMKDALLDLITERGFDAEDGFFVWVQQDEFGGVGKFIGETLERCEKHGVDPVAREADVALHIFAFLGTAYVNAMKPHAKKV